MQRESMVFYRTWLESIENVNDEKTQAAILIKVLRYGLYGETPNLTASEEKMIIPIILPQIDANNKKYMNGCKGGEYGMKGGRPKKNPLGDIDKNPLGDLKENGRGQNSKTPNEYVNDSDNDNAYVDKGAHAQKRDTKNRASKNWSFEQRDYGDPVAEERMLLA